MQSKDPKRQHTPDDDPEPNTPGTGEDVCPECHGTGKQIDKKTGSRQTSLANAVTAQALSSRELVERL